MAGILYEELNYSHVERKERETDRKRKWRLQGT
jgi:hypothetical protein